jgi:hypothetical protein
MIILIGLDDTLIVNPFSRGVFPYLARMFEEAKPGINYLSSFEQEGIKRRRDRKLVESYDWDFIIKSVASSFNLNVKIDVGEIVRMFCKPPYISLADNAIELLHGLKSNLHEVILVSNGYLKFLSSQSGGYKSRWKIGLSKGPKSSSISANTCIRILSNQQILAFYPIYILILLNCPMIGP